MYYIYLLLCSDKSIYTGITTNLDRRFEEHKSGKASKYTKVRTPLKMICINKVKGRSEATKIEIQTKKLSHAMKMKYFCE